jgi:hypothetical protein
MDPADSGPHVGDEEFQVSVTTVNAEDATLLGYHIVSDSKYRRSEGLCCLQLQGKSVLEKTWKRIDTEG